MRYTLDDIRREHEESLKRIRQLPYARWLQFTQYLSKKADEYLGERARNIYLCYLALREFKSETERAPALNLSAPRNGPS
jgi:hypothetical protein